MTDDFIDYFFMYVLIPFIGVLILFVMWMFVWLMPHSFINERACLEKGYPKAETTWDGHGYCITMDGAIRIPVEKLP